MKETQNRIYQVRIPISKNNVDSLECKHLPSHVENGQRTDAISANEIPSYLDVIPTPTSRHEQGEHKRDIGTRFSAQNETKSKLPEHTPSQSREVLNSPTKSPVSRETIDKIPQDNAITSQVHDRISTKNARKSSSSLSAHSEKEGGTSRASVKDADKSSIHGESFYEINPKGSTPIRETSARISTTKSEERNIELAATSEANEDVFKANGSVNVTGGQSALDMKSSAKSRMSSKTDAEQVKE